MLLLLDALIQSMLDAPIQSMLVWEIMDLNKYKRIEMVGSVLDHAIT
jgi:hypothetical protein